MMFRNLFKKKPPVINQVTNMCQCQGGVMIINEHGELYSVMPDSAYGWKVELIVNVNRR